ncbi:MAG: inositol monophosphatase family protein, partial [Acidimicrobiales bacterium]
MPSPPPSPPPGLTEELLAVATEAATRAAELIVAASERGHHDIYTKSSPTDLVSEVDRAAERCVVSVLDRYRPNDAILAEEGTSRPGTTGIRWVIDPLDGTTNFLFGIPAFAVSVAAELDGQAVAGVVIDPSRQETFAAMSGA